METKVLLTGIISFIAGGLLVSTAAVTIDKPDTNSPHGAMSTRSMAAELEHKTGDEFDKAFLAGMVAHHEDAVGMAMLAKQQAKHDDIKQLSQEIISAQRHEITLMQQWQRDWGYIQQDPARGNGR